MSDCKRYNPDNIFTKFKVIEFPISYVGLWTKQFLDLETDLMQSAYLKTMCEGNLMRFVEARKISASHRSFLVHQIDEHSIQITFHPISECVGHVKRKNTLDNRFVFDLRLIKADGLRCCNNEFHWEVGRYYISGQFEYCKITHFPNQIDFDTVIMETKVKSNVRIRNESSLIAAKFEYVRVSGFEVVPNIFKILPNATQLLSVTVHPTCLKIRDTLTFRVRNPHDGYNTDEDKEEENFLTYKIKCKVKIVYNKPKKVVKIESLHKLIQQDVRYAFTTEDELKIKQRSREAAAKHLQIFKSTYAKKPILEKYTTGRVTCYEDNLTVAKPKPPKNFCKMFRQHTSIYDLLYIMIVPFSIEFGRIALSSQGSCNLTLINNSKHDIILHFLIDDAVCYTEDRLTETAIAMKPNSKSLITVYCSGYVEGNYNGTFEYVIDYKYYRKHPYNLQVGNPTLVLPEKVLKFGMISSDTYVTSVPVRIHNYFNIPVAYTWDDITSEMPFEIIPHKGVVPQHSTKICDIFYICKPSKTKVYEIDFKSLLNKIIPIELNVMTRKLSIKFVQLNVSFKDIPLNLECIESVKLENASREMASFYVVEPLIPGVRVEPMNGNIRPKMVISFRIIVKICCVMDFAFDIVVKINNKENVTLPISGSVVEPRISIHPKVINIARVPSYMVVYVPVTFHNLGSLKTLIEVLDTEDSFHIFIAQGNDKQRIYEFYVEGGQSKTIFVKIYDTYRREYEKYLPFKVNGLIGPPDENACSIELQHYLKEFEESYENNPKVKVKMINKDISYCRLLGVITLPWVQFSSDDFEIEYTPNGKNTIEFTMKNVSRYYLYVTILIAKLSPHFSIHLLSEEEQVIINDHCIKFDFDRQKKAELSVKFIPKGYGRFVSTAILFLDRNMTVAYSNLTFIGKRLTPTMTSSTPRIIFPPSRVGTVVVRTLTVKIDTLTDIDSFSCLTKEEPNLTVTFLSCEQGKEENDIYTLVTIELKVACRASYARTLTMTFNHDSGSGCEIDISFYFTYCPLTLHTNFLISETDNPYPFFPLSSQHDLYQYLETSKTFLEKWMFLQGFRRDLYPEIPETFHAISLSLSSQGGGLKKGLNVSFLNYMRRIAGPLMKHVRKTTPADCDESFKIVKEIYDTYKEIINLIKSRGSSLWTLQPRFLLSHDQLVIYSEHETAKYNADIILIKELVEDPAAFNRISKQSWMDVILQSYKVFVLDSCFFDCICVSNQPRDIIKNITNWYNEHIQIHHNKLRGKDKPVKVITNLTTDLSDGIAIISSFLSYCPYLTNQFSTFCEIDAEEESGIINNACLIIETMNCLKLLFPLTSKDFLQPNFVHMLFLSIHLYVSLPMFTPKDTIMFNPPLLRSSIRHVAVGPASPETLIFSYVLMNNENNSFVVEKGPAENGKKIFLTVKFKANFVHEENCVLFVHGYNKTRIFDTFIVFLLRGNVSALYPIRKCKVTGPLYRPNKVDVLVGSPFLAEGHFTVSLTDIEPKVPIVVEEIRKPHFFLRRLSLIDTEITLSGLPQENSQEYIDSKLHMQVICLSTQVGSSWIWFKGETGEFFIKVTTQPRWDMATETLQAKMQTWPMDPCSCGEACECYRTTTLMVPHRNELMVKALRHALFEHASENMMNIFDRLISIYSSFSNFTQPKPVIDLIMMASISRLQQTVKELRLVPIFGRFHGVFLNIYYDQCGAAGESPPATKDFADLIPALGKIFVPGVLDSNTGRIILAMLLEEGGTNMSEVNHILQSETNYRVTSRTLHSRWSNVKLAPHTNGVLTLPITLPSGKNDFKNSMVLTSACGMDIRTYRILFIKENIHEAVSN